jgi:hypothetical protein
MSPSPDETARPDAQASDQDTLNTPSPSPQGLGGPLKAWLVMLIILGPLATILTFPALDEASWTNAHTNMISIPTWPFIAVIVLNFLVPVGAVALLNRHKWGFFFLVGCIAGEILLFFVAQSVLSPSSAHIRITVTPGGQVEGVMLVIAYGWLRQTGRWDALK